MKEIKTTLKVNYRRSNYKNEFLIIVDCRVVNYYQSVKILLTNIQFFSIYIIFNKIKHKFLTFVVT